MKLLLTVGLLHIVLKSPPLPLCSPLLSSPLLSSIDNCLDEGWLKHRPYTPNSPVNLEVELDTRKDEEGHLVPVLVARWKAQDDGSISFLKGTELHVLKKATNQNLCVRYEFFNKIPMRNPAYEKVGRITSDQFNVVVEPGLSYVVSVSNLPKPNLKYSVLSSDIVPLLLCEGSLWRPNTTLERSTGPQGRTMLTVGFGTDQHSHNYRVSLLCSNNRQWQDTDMVWL
uniref:IL17RA/B N-terminal domain-containing protein n=1 Tax=Hucho hucho TaxID=62062 RepID=A0A4W5NUS0_9TELE